MDKADLPVFLIGIGIGFVLLSIVGIGIPLLIDSTFPELNLIVERKVSW